MKNDETNIISSSIKISFFPCIPHSWKCGIFNFSWYKIIDLRKVSLCRSSIPIIYLSTQFYDSIPFSCLYLEISVRSAISWIIERHVVFFAASLRHNPSKFKIDIAFEIRKRIEKFSTSSRVYVIRR